MQLAELFSHPWWHVLGAALVHFLWQGSLLALLLFVALAVLPAGRPHWRYLAGVATLLLMAICPAITFAVLRPSVETELARRAQEESLLVERTVPPEAQALDWDPITLHLQEDVAAPGALRQDIWLGEVDAVLNSAEPESLQQATATAPPPVGKTLRDALEAFRPVLLAVWLVGVAVLEMRLLFGALLLVWLRHGRSYLPESLRMRTDHLRRRLGLARPIRVCITQRVGEALVTGLVRPVIVVPAAWLAEMSPAQLEAVIAHELAHVRRWDLWVNLMQRIVETLLFYHPAVWWVSERIREERELCCDQLAVLATGQRLPYAEALEYAARRRAEGVRPVMATSLGGGRKMRLLNRVQAVLGRPTRSQPGEWSGAAVAILVLPAAMWFASSLWTPAVAANDPPAPESADAVAEVTFEATLAEPEEAVGEVTVEATLAEPEEAEPPTAESADADDVVDLTLKNPVNRGAVEFTGNLANPIAKAAVDLVLENADDTVERKAVLVPPTPAGGSVLERRVTLSRNGEIVADYTENNSDTTTVSVPDGGTVEIVADYTENNSDGQEPKNLDEAKATIEKLRQQIAELRARDREVRQVISRFTRPTTEGDWRESDRRSALENLLSKAKKSGDDLIINRESLINWMKSNVERKEAQPGSEGNRSGSQLRRKDDDLNNPFHSDEQAVPGNLLRNNPASAWSRPRAEVVIEPATKRTTATLAPRQGDSEPNNAQLLKMLQELRREMNEMRQQMMRGREEDRIHGEDLNLQRR
ncbi:MAG: M56 family metallopeptidase [Pirellulales bacterium]